MPRRRFCSAGGAVVGRERCSRASRWGSPSPLRQAAVLLDVHWLTDVIAGLALGWAWFSVCAIAFGGRILRFGVAAEQAARVADVAERPISSRR